jgi:hypothetical protein
VGAKEKRRQLKGEKNEQINGRVIRTARSQYCGQTKVIADDTAWFGVLPSFILLKRAIVRITRCSFLPKRINRPGHRIFTAVADGQSLNVRLTIGIPAHLRTSGASLAMCGH